MSILADISLNPSFSEKHCSLLAELSAEIYREAGALEQVVPGERTRQQIADLISVMNGYYSNLISGEKALPSEVKLALTERVSEPSFEEDNRRSTVFAHIETERLMREKIVSAAGGFSVHSPDFIKWLHAEFFTYLPDSKPITQPDSGAFRNSGVTLGRYERPLPREIPTILTEFDRYFSDQNWLATDRLSVAAAAHHRLAWVHPFIDGNGRVIRLHSHACLIQGGVDGGGLWSLSRGLARNRQSYYDSLARADILEPFDGRNRLSGNGLGEFSHFFLESILEQIQFMKDLLQLKSVTLRMEKYIHYELTAKKHGEALARLLRAIYIEGEIARGDVRLITGLRDTAAREVINLAFKHQLIQSPTPKGKLALRFPLEALDAFFPRLYLDLPG